jgi:uncharacterized protein YndB with AHSA1/START domain
MGRFEVKVKTRLNASTQAVWDYLMTHDEWRRPYVPVVTKLTEGAIRVGSRFENHVRGGGRQWTVINEMTRVEPPHRLTWRQANKAGPTTTVEGNYLLEATDSGTEFTMHNILETVGWRSGPVWFNRWILQKRVYPTFFRQLRQALDGSDASVSMRR